MSNTDFVMKQPVDFIILFDGDCNLCSRAVQFVLRRDRLRLFHYAALQSVAGQRIVQELGVGKPRFETVLLVKKGKVFVASSAVLEIVKNLPGGWFLLYGLIVVPRPVRDFFYRVIAKKRSRLFGKRSQCLVSVQGWEDRFLI